MLFLALSVICSALIANLLKSYEKVKGADIFYIFLGNYFLASLFSYFNASSLAPTKLSLSLGAITGAFFLGNFLLYNHNIGKNGISLSTGAMRFSLVIPLCFAFFAFGEKIRLINGIGIGLVLFSFYALTQKKQAQSIILLLILFICNGLTDFCLILFNHYEKNASGSYIFTLFTSALILNFLYLLVNKKAVCVKSFALGLILGIPNQLCTYFFLRALTSLPASIVYPIYSASIVLVCIVADILFWKKRFSRKESFALIVMIGGIFLLNVKP